MKEIFKDRYIIRTVVAFVFLTFVMVILGYGFYIIDRSFTDLLNNNVNSQNTTPDFSDSTARAKIDTTFDKNGNGSIEENEMPVPPIKPATVYDIYNFISR